MPSVIYRSSILSALLAGLLAIAPLAHDQTTSSQPSVCPRVEVIPPPAEYAETAARSLYLLGMKAFGKGKNEDNELYQKFAFGNLEQAAGLGFPEAQYFLSLLYREGYGGQVPIDLAMAAAWAECAAENGSVLAQHLIGILYMSGIGVGVDYDKAMKWFQRGARSRDAASQTGVGMLYFEGLGVRKDIETARRWFSMAAKKGDPYAEKMLDRIDAAQTQLGAPLDTSGFVSQTWNPSDPVITKFAGWGDFLKFQERPMDDNSEIIPWLKRNIYNLDPPYIYELSRRTLIYDQREAFTWFWVAGLRSRYDAFRCTDETARSALSTLPQIAREVAVAMKTDEETAIQAITEALEWEKEFPAATDPSWVCLHGLAAIQASLANQDLRDRLIPQEEWSQIREEIRRAAYESAQNSPDLL